MFGSFRFPAAAPGSKDSKDNKDGNDKGISGLGRCP
jgi:hypothetical protein